MSLIHRLGAGAALALAACAGSSDVPAQDVRGALAWAAQQPVAAGTVASLPMPPNITSIPIRGPAQIAHLKDGRICVLLKTEIGFKDNFSGVLGCSGPVAKGEIWSYSSSGTTFTYVGMPGYGVFEELYIARQRDDRTFDVYFNLN